MKLYDIDNENQFQHFFLFFWRATGPRRRQRHGQRGMKAGPVLGGALSLSDPELPIGHDLCDRKEAFAAHFGGIAMRPTGVRTTEIGFSERQFRDQAGIRGAV
jgi:hypothetical protein